MIDGADQREANFEDASSRLNDGLKSCRSVVENYRVMLNVPQSEAQDADPDDEPATSAATPEEPE
jgi:hypothetical protein